MAQKSSGSQHGTRHKLSKDPEETVSINDHMKEFEEGEKVLIDYSPTVQEGRSHQRFHGRTAEVKGMRGEAYRLEVKDGGKKKQLFLKPIHLSETGE